MCQWVSDCAWNALKSVWKEGEGRPRPVWGVARLASQLAVECKPGPAICMPVLPGGFCKRAEAERKAIQQTPGGNQGLGFLGSDAD